MEAVDGPRLLFLVLEEKVEVARGYSVVTPWLLALTTRFCHARQAPAACKFSEVTFVSVGVSGCQWFRAHVTCVTVRSFPFRWRLLGVTELVSTVPWRCRSRPSRQLSRRLPSLCARLPKIRTLVVFVRCCLCSVVLPSVCLRRRRNTTTSSIPVKQDVLRFTAGVNWGVEVVSAVQNQGRGRSCWTSSTWIAGGAGSG